MKKININFVFALLLVMLINMLLSSVFVSAKSAPGNPEISRQIATEGMVLLKNEEQSLPLKSGEKVALFGVGQIDFIKGGGGSGTIKPEYVINLLQGMQAKEQEGKISIYKPLVEAYQKYAKLYAAAIEKMALNEMPITDKVVQDAAQQADTAIITIKRYSRESADRKPGKGDFELDDAEIDMVAKVTSKFNKVIVVLNVGGVIDTSWFRNNEKIDSVLLAWQPGMEGGNAVSDVLCGDVNPSGKLTDTFAKSYADYPSANNFNESKAFVNYEEDIFVGYRYFETFDPDYSRVNYEFGYGLSYTNFVIKNVNAAVKSEIIEVSAEVKNTGNTAGKEVVQVYFSAPQGVLGKPGKELAAFAKTNLLAPGETQTLTMPFAINDMSSYDDTGKVKKSAYVMEAGDYNIYVGNSLKNAGVNGIHYTYHVDSLRVTKQLSEQIKPLNLTKRLLANGQYESLAIVKAAESNNQDTPSDVAATNVPANASNSAQNKASSELLQNKNPKIMLKDVYYDRTKMNAFIEQLSNGHLAELSLGQPVKVLGGTGGIGNLEEFGIPSVQTADGPAGLRLIEPNTAWPCSTLVASTWNLELVKKMGAATAIEAKENKVDIWLAPGMNIHRNPLNGRNFEYYSEDPLITGKMAAAITKGVQDNGIAVTLKHFAANNKEGDRKSSDSRVSERALREIYLKGFEIAVAEAAPWCIMSSYNLVNGKPASENRELLTNILRNEWNYQGMVMTDWRNLNTPYKEVKAGNDVRMPGRERHTAEFNDIIAALAHGTLERSSLERNIKSVLEMIMKTETFKRQILNTEVPVISKSKASRIKAANFLWTSDAVNIEACEDDDKGINPIRTNAGEWMLYDINVEQAGKYEVTARVASKTVPNTKFNIYIDGELVGSIDPGEKTGDWQSWKTVSPIVVELPEGLHRMKVEFTKTGMNLNWLEFNSVNKLVVTESLLLERNPLVKIIVALVILALLFIVAIVFYKNYSPKRNI